MGDGDDEVAVAGNALRGRDGECRVIEGCLEEARTGRLAVLSIVGDPGTGKTGLCEYAGATAAGFEQARMTAVDGEADLALSGLSLLLRPLAAHIGGLAAPHRRLLDAVTGVSGMPVEDGFALGAATLALLSAAAEARPLLVVVDDAQWLDEPSAGAVAFALRRLEYDAVAVIVASRNPTRRLSPAGHKVIELGGLDQGAALAVLAERDPHFAKPIADKVVAATGGNPLALIEVAAQLSPDQRRGRQPLPDPLPVGGHLFDLYQQRLKPLPADCKLALAVLAAAGTGTHLIGPALEQLGIETADLEPAEQAGIVTVADTAVGFEFRHPLVRAAALQLLTPAQRRSVHTALAHAAEGDPERYATHLAAAATGPSFPVADALLAAADQAKRCSGRAAPGILERAALLTPPGDVAQRRRIKAAQALAVGGQLGAATGHLDHVIATTRDNFIRSDAALMRAVTAVLEPSALQVVETIRREAEQVALVNPRRAAAALALASITLSSRGDIPAALEFSERAYSMLRSAGADELQVLGVLAATRILAGRRHEGEALITDDVLTRWLDRADQPGSGAIDLAVGPNPLLWSEQHDRAAQFCGAMIDAYRRRASPYALAQLTGTFCEVLWWTGRWDEAVGVGEEALVLCRQTGQHILATAPAAVLARLLACRGDEARCRDLVSKALSTAEAFGHVIVRLLANHAAGLCDLSAGRPHEAVVSFLKCEQIATRIGLEEVCVIPYGADLIEALIRCGNHHQARRLVRLHTERAERVDSKWGLATIARCRAMLADGEDADVLFKQAIVGHPVGSFEEGRTRLCWGEHLRRRNQRRESRDQLERAVLVFDALSARPWAERTRSELHAVGAPTAPAPPAALQTLTAKELQVAIAVGHGMSNREAAAALFVSPKTVEHHLGRVYAKLGVSTRTQLVNYLNSATARRQADSRQNRQSA